MTHKEKLMNTLNELFFEQEITELMVDTFERLILDIYNDGVTQGFYFCNKGFDLEDCI